MEFRIHRSRVKGVKAGLRDRCRYRVQGIRKDRVQGIRKKLILIPISLMLYLTPVLNK